MDITTGMTAENTDPRKISQALLDRTGHAILDNDPDDFAASFIYPHTVHTFEGHVVIHNVTELLSIFHAVQETYMNMGVTLLERHCTAATFVTSTLVQSHYESRVLSGSQLVLRPFPALTELHMAETGWRVGNCQYAIAEAPKLVNALIHTLPRN